jgi:FKBP-type peptidyl-prolyl cis-trans isomerase
MNYPVLAALAVAVASLHAADEAKPATPAAAAPAPAAVPSPAAQPKMLTPEQQKQAFYLQGFFLAGQTPLPQITSQLELSDEELDQVIAGMRAAVKGEQPKVKPDDALIAGAEKFFAERVAGKSKRWAAQNEAFLAKVDADKDVVKSPSGLRYKIVTPGTDPKPVASSTVKCRYTGKLVDGKVFDSTANRGNEPAEFGLGQVIPAWTEGVQKIGKGGKIVIYAPAALGYGKEGQGPIPGESVLEFEVELVEFK